MQPALSPSKCHIPIITTRGRPCLDLAIFTASLGLLLSSQGHFEGELKPS